MIEGPGHVPMDQIKMNVEKEIEVCHEAPSLRFGPARDGYCAWLDHITSAIGAVLAGWAGASMLCYVTPKEHLGLPNKDDVRPGRDCLQNRRTRSRYRSKTPRGAKAGRRSSPKRVMNSTGRTVRFVARSRDCASNARRNLPSGGVQDCSFLLDVRAEILFNENHARTYATMRQRLTTRSRAWRRCRRSSRNLGGELYVEAEGVKESNRALASALRALFGQGQVEAAGCGSSRLLCMRATIRCSSRKPNCGF